MCVQSECQPGNKQSGSRNSSKDKALTREETARQPGADVSHTTLGRVVMRQ